MLLALNKLSTHSYNNYELHFNTLLLTNTSCLYLQFLSLCFLTVLVFDVLVLVYVMSSAFGLLFSYGLNLVCCFILLDYPYYTYPWEFAAYPKPLQFSTCFGLPQTSHHISGFQLTTSFHLSQ